MKKYAESLLKSGKPMFCVRTDIFFIIAAYYSSIRTPPLCRSFYLIGRVSVGGIP